MFLGYFDEFTFVSLKSFNFPQRNILKFALCMVIIKILPCSLLLKLEKKDINFSQFHIHRMFKALSSKLGDFF